MAVSRTAADRELGAELKNARTRAGLSLRALADRLGAGWSDTKLSFIENGRRAIRQEDLAYLLDVLGVTGPDRDRLVALRTAGSGHGDHVAAATSIRASLAQLIEQEAQAQRITTVSLGLWPGLLQTRAVTKAILGEVADLDTLIALRMGRQEIITRADNPVELRALLDAQLLTRPIAPPPVMAAQLRHLLTMIERPNVTVQIIPSHTASPHLTGAFVLMQFPTSSPAVHREHLTDGETLWDIATVRPYLDAVDKIMEAAMTPARTAEVIEEIVNGMGV